MDEKAIEEDHLKSKEIPEPDDIADGVDVSLGGSDTGSLDNNQENPLTDGSFDSEDSPRGGYRSSQLHSS